MHPGHASLSLGEIIDSAVVQSQSRSTNRSTSIEEDCSRNSSNFAQATNIHVRMCRGILGDDSVFTFSRGDALNLQATLIQIFPEQANCKKFVPRQNYYPLFRSHPTEPLSLREKPHI